MIEFTEQQKNILHWYAESLYAHESVHNNWAKNNKDQWINNLLDSFSSNDEATFQKRYNKIANLYGKKDNSYFVFPFIDSLNNEIEYLYRS